MCKFLWTSTMLLCLAGSTGVAVAGCPSGLAAKLMTTPLETAPGLEYGTFEWYTYLGGTTTFEAGDQLEMSFAVVPFDHGWMTVGGDEEGGRTGYAMVFAEGAVCEVEGGELIPLLEYQPGAWLNVQAVFDFSSREVIYTVDEIATGPQPFNFPDTRTLSSVRVNLGNLGVGSNSALGWLDDVRVLKRTPESRTVLFEASFDAGDPPNLFQGRMSFAPFQEAGASPGTCPQGPTAVTSIDWQGLKSLYR